MNRRRWSLRTWLITVPATLLVLMFLLQDAQPAASWNSVMDGLGVSDGRAYTNLMVWAILLLGVMAVYRVLRSPGNDDG